MKTWIILIFNHIPHNAAFRSVLLSYCLLLLFSISPGLAVGSELRDIERHSDDKQETISMVFTSAPSFNVKEADGSSALVFAFNDARLADKIDKFMNEDKPPLQSENLIRQITLKQSSASTVEVKVDVSGHNGYKISGNPNSNKIEVALYRDLEPQPAVKENAVEYAFNVPDKSISERGEQSPTAPNRKFDEAIFPAAGFCKDPDTIPDPLEGFNRVMFDFNDKFYFWVLKPVTLVYSTIVGQDVMMVTENFFDNLLMPVRFVNSLLQFKYEKAAIELARFAINTTAGIGGLGDVAANSSLHLTTSPEDTGQTLAFYGFDQGFYIVWPFFGPKSLRDSFGYVGDQFLIPYNFIRSSDESLGVNAYVRLNHYSLHIGEYEDLKNASLDPYVALRDLYLQYRKELIRK